jgi:hypothetical protein
LDQSVQKSSRKENYDKESESPFSKREEKFRSNIGFAADIATLIGFGLLMESQIRKDNSLVNKVARHVKKEVYEISETSSKTVRNYFQQKNEQISAENNKAIEKRNNERIKRMRESMDSTK